MEFRSVKYVGIIERHVMAVTTKHKPLAVVHIGRVTITTRRLLAWINSNLYSSWVTLTMGSCVLWSKMKVSCSSEFAWWTMRALPLLHHIVVLVEACICILNNESILQLNWSRSKETFTWFMLLCSFLYLWSLSTFCCWKRLVLDGQERIVIESIGGAGHT